MGRLAIVEEDDVSTDSSAIVPPNKKCRTTDTCGYLKANPRSNHNLSEAQAKAPKKHQTHKRAQRQRIQCQNSRKTKGISDESGYFEDIDDDGNDTPVANPVFTCSSPITRSDYSTVAAVINTQPAGNGYAVESSGQKQSLDASSKYSRESIEIIYDRNAEMYDKNTNGIVHFQSSHQHLSKGNDIFHPKPSSLLKNELLKDHISHNQKLNNEPEKVLKDQQQNSTLIHPLSKSSVAIPSSTTIAAVTTASSSSSAPHTARTKSDNESSGKTFRQIRNLTSTNLVVIILYI